MSQLIVDPRGQPLFRCTKCGVGITEDDVYAQGLRLPEPGESADEYMEAELVDSLHHVDCRVALQAG